MAREEIDGGEAVLEAFRNLDIEYIIASPGSDWPSVWEALARQKVNEADGPRYIDTWHETLAVTMAMGYTRVTGKLQAVMLHAGVGLLQGSLGIHGAYQGEIPMLICSGESITNGEDPDFDPGGQWYRGLNVVGGADRWVEPFTKWSSHVSTHFNLYESITRAGEMAQRLPKGPTFLDIPMEVMLPAWTPPPRMGKIPAPPKTHSEASAIDEVARLLAGASSPVIISESAGKDVEAFHQTVRLAEMLSIPVVESSPGYANFPKDHPMYQGTNVNLFKDTSDVILLVGSKTPWYPPSKGPATGTVISIDEYPLKEHLTYQALHANIYLEGDIGVTVRLLADAVEANGGLNAVEISARKSQWESEHNKATEGHRATVEAAKDKGPIDPVWLCAAISEVMPDDATYIEETITHRGAILRHIAWNTPQRYFHPNGGLGQGLGTALGVKLARPNSPVVALMGDGSFLYNPVVQSFGISAAENLPILIIVFNNGKYQAMQNLHLQFYPDGVAAKTGIHHGVDITGPNYADLIKPFGGHSERVEDPAELKPALERALAAVNGGTTALVDVIVNA